MSKVARTGSPTESNSSTSPRDFARPKAKRSRVALACLRCRSRKQKCDGAQDVCSTCKRLGVRCQYKAHPTPRPDQKKLYIKNLEDHIAELENLLAESGHDTVTVDHWKEKRSAIRRDSYFPERIQADDFEEQAATTKDPVWNVDMNADNDRSTLPLGRLVSSLVRPVPLEESLRRNSSTISLLTQLAPPEMATRLLNGWIEHMSTQYPVIHTPQLRALQNKPLADLDICEESILHLVYANSGRILEAIGDTGDFHAESHHEAAVRNIETVLAPRDIRSIQYLTLLALYCLRGPRSASAWTLGGLAMRQCIEMGLHRSPRDGEVCLDGEIRSRVFWSCYYLDRGVSVALGRPPAISDEDIDVDYPLDVDEHIEDVGVLQAASEDRFADRTTPPTTLTAFIHFLRLRSIESRIEQVIYRPNKKSQADTAVVENFLAQLAGWRAAVLTTYNESSMEPQKRSASLDMFMLPYYKCIRLLLHSQLPRKNPNPQHLKICAEACAGLCGAYKRLNRINKVDCSPLALQSLFLSGLTLLYCAWLAPPGTLDVSDAITNCNLMLYVMAERSPSAQRYRDVFERIKMNVMDVLERGSNSGTRKTGVLDAEMTQRCQSLDGGMLDTVKTDYDQIITDLAKDTARVGLRDLATLSSHLLDSPGGLDTRPEDIATQMWNENIPALPAVPEYGIAHSFGTFIESAFMFNLDDLNDFDMNMHFQDGLDAVSFLDTM
ncbi:hypothetical protein IQ07DRAFT_681933 [Pyrenochaeta sp. DS3sAY3a]|nr:hypothetical protein IQ07DRAFT_681933 [Pyrenochaeta sp. DS3sAY3a]